LLGLALFGLARRVGLVQRRSRWSGRILSGIVRAASEDDYQEQQRRCESKTDCTKKCGWGHFGDLRRNWLGKKSVTTALLCLRRIWTFVNILLHSAGRTRIVSSQTSLGW
jgi:hypothetical protein